LICHVIVNKLSILVKALLVLAQIRVNLFLLSSMLLKGFGIEEIKLMKEGRSYFDRNRLSYLNSRGYTVLPPPFDTVIHKSYFHS